MIPIKRQLQIQYGPDYWRPDGIIRPKNPSLIAIRARGAAERGIESLRFQVSIVRR